MTIVLYLYGGLRGWDVAGENREVFVGISLGSLRKTSYCEDISQSSVDGCNKIELLTFAPPVTLRICA